MAHELMHLVPYVVNFTIVIILLVVLTKKPLKKFLFQRHERIQDLVLSSEKQFQVAKQKNDKLVAQKSALPSDLSAIEKKEKDAAGELSSKMLSAAASESLRIASEAKRLAVLEAETLGAKIKAEFVDQVIRKTEAVLEKSLGNDAHVGVLSRARSSMEAEIS